ncbi:MAG: hypothetical protein SPF38_10485 [Dysosmobacter sp.]|nr:hypothetical protein [Dysosmobacter sp.]
MAFIRNTVEKTLSEDLLHGEALDNIACSHENRGFMEIHRISSAGEACLRQGFAAKRENAWTR